MCGEIHKILIRYTIRYFYIISEEPGILAVLVTSLPFLSIILISLLVSVSELVAYIFTLDSPAVLNAIALADSLPAPLSLILFVKLIFL